ncbi:hypothetical protein FA95DRAFT_1562916 [Auriscalpium vulgare]|uniref:Uncharacterized protein n=2 Tax=Auriscalpium vulgare TaxID=40419 RepID=A0ACB8RJ48_9AGAM|nr:hypothetical protein FA95DRAFT_1562882 [Auriscalpium vulgare]KAI0043838.1 hypothetical protein FA95DRAFT_1562916 [Auriscalpium vulgare]
MSFSHFRVTITSASVSSAPALPSPAPVPDLATSAPTTVKFRANVDPATSRASGSFEWDKEEGGYGGEDGEWESREEFMEWLEDEQKQMAVEYRRTHTKHGGALWTTKETFVCSGQGTGGKSKYSKKHPDRDRKIEHGLLLSASPAAPAAPVPGVLIAVPRVDVPPPETMQESARNALAALRAVMDSHTSAAPP